MAKEEKKTVEGDKKKKGMFNSPCGDYNGNKIISNDASGHNLITARSIGISQIEISREQEINIGGSINI